MARDAERSPQPFSPLAPLARRQILEARELIEEAALLLLCRAPADPVGVACVQVLLEDGATRCIAMRPGHSGRAAGGGDHGAGGATGDHRRRVIVSPPDRAPRRRPPRCARRRLGRGDRAGPRAAHAARRRRRDRRRTPRAATGARRRPRPAPRDHPGVRRSCRPMDHRRSGPAAVRTAGAHEAHPGRDRRSLHSVGSAPARRRSRIVPSSRWGSFWLPSMVI